MDLINPTGELMAWKFDNQEYQFNPGELVRVSDGVGRHMLKHLKVKGLTEVRYGDDPIQVSLAGLRAICSFHEMQLEIHERNNEEQAEKDFPKLPEPDGVKQARKALDVYRPLLEKAEAEAAGEEAERMKEQIEAGVAKTVVAGMVSLDDMDLDQLRSQLKKLGGDAEGALNRRTLMARIRRITEVAQEGIDAADEKGEEA